jgi:hypothetical protein
LPIWFASGKAPRCREQEIKLKRGSHKAFFLVIAFLISFPIHARAQNDQASIEIEKLLLYIKGSGCEFNRNGDWYSSMEAAEHINKKYQYALKKGLIGSAEDFISYAATESSLSGKPYLVKCSDTETLTSAEWLINALKQIRERK